MNRLMGVLIIVLLCTSCSLTKKTGDLNNIDFTDNNKLALQKYDPPVVLETVGAINPDVEFLNNETLENNVHTKWVLERLGIQIKYNWTILDVNNSYSNRIRLELVKGTLPDIVTTRDVELIQELIDSGEFMEVSQLFDDYASEVWKKAMNENPEVWEFVTRGEHKYAIPILDYQYSSDPILWIRDDWLHHLGLEEPTTFEQLEEVLRAFTQDDPDGNSIDDTFGLSVSLSHGTNTWMADSSWIFGSFGTIPRQWMSDEDGQFVYGSILPETKKGLALLSSWLSKGYISYESQWYDEIKAAQMFSEGKAGIVAGPYWMSGWPLSDLLTNDADASFKAISIPVNEEGLALRRGSLPVNGAILINKKMENPEIFFTYQNYLFDYYATSTGEFKYGLARGYDWNVANGKYDSDVNHINSNDILPGNIRVAAYTLTFDGARIPSKISEEEPVEAINVLLSQKDASHKSKYSGPPTTTMKTRWEFLQVLEQKTFDSILFGDMSIDAFDEFQTRWYKNGGSDITKEVNE